MSVDFSRLPREKLIALLLESRKQADAAKAEAAALCSMLLKSRSGWIFPKRNTPPRQSSSPKLLP